MKAINHNKREAYSREADSGFVHKGKLTAQIMVSLDGFMEGKHQELDWHVVDEEYDKYAIDMLNASGGLVFGRKTYEHMAQFWPTSLAAERFPQVAERMNGLPKLVFSKTLREVNWTQTELVSGHAVQHLAQEKQQPGRSLLILGSAGLVSSLTSQELGLIDEYHIIVNPVLLGEGKPYFQNLTDRASLKLIDSHSFTSGNVLLVYRPV